MSDRPVPSLRSVSTLRTILFWPHLIAGVTAGLLILLMSVTGVLLTYERQLIAWSDRGYVSMPTPRGRLPLGTLLERVRARHPDVTPTAVTMVAGPTAPSALAIGPRTLLVDAYSGQVLGESTQSVRRAMADIRAWHRWLAVEGEGRATARFFTGWANALFLFIVMSGFYLWFPRKWTWQHIRPNVIFNGNLRGKARDFNWHHVIGVWSLVPLFLIVVSALPMSFPWANAALYRMAGDEPPKPAGPREGAAAPVIPAPESLNTLWDRAASQERGWRTITVRMPGSANAPLAFAIDRGTGGQPQLRSTLTLNRDGEVVRYEQFSDQRPGARLRAVSRFTHTGEVLGLTGQTIAGLASAGASVLVCTGIALAFRRFRAWLKRRAERSMSAATETAA